jgi:hypothetical protein
MNLTQKIRRKPDYALTVQHNLLQLLFVSILGAVLGFLAKYTDGSVVGLIGDYLGFWVLATAIVVAWSRSPEIAALHALAFLASMLAVYYAYSMVLFGFFPAYQFVAWSSIAALSPIGGYIVWHARGNGWIAATCAALPISLLLAEGYSFTYVWSIPALAPPRGFALLSAAFLIMVLPASHLQRLRILPIAIAMSLAIQHLVPWY